MEHAEDQVERPDTSDRHFLDSPDSMASLDLVGPYFHYLAGNQADDLRQEVILRLLIRSRHEPAFWDSISNKCAYIRIVAKRIFLDTQRSARQMIMISLDDENECLLLTELSDKGEHAVKTLTKCDQKNVWQEIHRLLDNCTDDEKTIFQLKFLEDCKPRDIASRLKLSHMVVQTDCNRLHAKIRYRMRSLVKDK